MKTLLAAAVSLLLALVAACDRDADSLDLGAARPAPDATTAVDARSQRDLASALDRVERGDRDAADEGYRRVVRSFQGRRYRWTVQLIAPLCRADRCNVLAFAGGGRGETGQSWMPRLELEPDQRQALLDRCAGQTSCRVEFEGRMSKLIASTEQFTSVTFDRVRIAD